MEGRCIGLDVHRDFCEVAVLGGREGRALAAGERPARTACRSSPQQLRPTDRVALEATGNALAIARIIRPHVKEVVIVNTRQLQAIADSKQKTDRHDARTLASCSPPGCSSTPGCPTSRRERRAGGSRVARSWSSRAHGARTRSSPSCTATSSTAHR